MNSVLNESVGFRAQEAWPTNGPPWPPAHRTMAPQPHEFSLIDIYRSIDGPAEAPGSHVGVVFSPIQ